MAKRPCIQCRRPADGSRCQECDREAGRSRGSSTAQGYGRLHRLVFREGVLTRDPICRVCLTSPSTVADHYPMSRKELVEARLDPNDPKRGRGLCKPCHDRETAKNQPGGWNA